MVECISCEVMKKKRFWTMVEDGLRTRNQQDQGIGKVLFWASSTDQNGADIKSRLVVQSLFEHIFVVDPSNSFIFFHLYKAFRSSTTTQMSVWFHGDVSKRRTLGQLTCRAILAWLQDNPTVSDWKNNQEKEELVHLPLRFSKIGVSTPSYHPF